MVQTTELIRITFARNSPYQPSAKLSHLRNPIQKLSRKAFMQCKCFSHGKRKSGTASEDQRSGAPEGGSLNWLPYPQIVAENNRMTFKPGVALPGSIHSSQCYPLAKMRRSVGLSGKNPQNTCGNVLVLTWG
ncbi:hypothetical protein CEXT_276241 [Caerostris extrusa]|uniref:Uncharacterized protein n=1 Tax=Caerostris extrusa TaxID=172846 RepID=A0AAV4Y239_CAEEX|nr:hypothetical protein CEXT_276241 [Caerostris extrusa]